MAFPVRKAISIIFGFSPKENSKDTENNFDFNTIWPLQAVELEVIPFLTQAGFHKYGT